MLSCCSLHSSHTGVWLICEPESASLLRTFHGCHSTKSKSSRPPCSPRPCSICLSPPCSHLLLLSPLFILFRPHGPPCCSSDMPSISGTLYWLFPLPGTLCLTSSRGCFFLSFRSQVQLHLFSEALNKTLLVLLSSWNY